MSEHAVQVEDYEASKTYWETFEYEDERFPYPRKNCKYIATLAVADGMTEAALNRATNYFDSDEVWLLRAEGYLYLAERADPEQKAELARRTYDFTAPLLEADLPRHGDAHKYDNALSQNGTRTLDNVIEILRQATLMSRDSDHMQSYGQYLRGGFPDRLEALGSTPEQITEVVHYAITRFEAPLNPAKYCALGRISRNEISEREADTRYIGCLVCQIGLSEYPDGCSPVSGNLKNCKFEDN